MRTGSFIKQIVWCRPEGERNAQHFINYIVYIAIHRWINFSNKSLSIFLYFYRKSMVLKLSNSTNKNKKSENQLKQSKMLTFNSVGIQRKFSYLKGVIAKNERGYWLTAKNNR